MRIITGLFVGFTMLFMVLAFLASDIASEDQKRTAVSMCKEETGHLPKTEFISDGCTLWPDAGIRSCCIEHDMDYWCGGKSERRKAADTAFRQCVEEQKGQTQATISYIGVRVFGPSWLPTWWRWGYGWPWPDSSYTK